MIKEHHYAATVQWTGNTGTGTNDYKAYERSHVISSKDKPDIAGSSDPVFRGDKTKYNPEDLMVSSLSACHMLWYLHFCAVNGVVVTSYVDIANGTMAENEDGSGQFSKIVLHPEVVVKDKSMIEKAIEMHKKAHHSCFIARSVNFEVQIQPDIKPE
ncbi:MAG: OsmC family protein [Flammeovirgaceae bacterium]